MTEPRTEPPMDLLPTTRRALLHRLATAQADGRAPSTVAAVVRDGEPVWCQGRGAVTDLDTQYRIGSITKTFVATLVLRLRDEGLIDLADPLGKHLDTPQAGEATIAQLLAHSSGLAAEADGPWWERTPGELRPELPDLFGEHPQRHPAGRRHHYSNPGYALLGALVEQLRGRHWGDALRSEVLEPLGMARTTLLPAPPYAQGWAVHPWADVLQREPAVDTGRMAPAGQLWSTAADLCRFAAFLAEGDDRVLSAHSVAEMRTPAVAPEESDWAGSYGLGMQLMRKNGRLLAGHTGSMPGYVACVWLDVPEGLATVALGNVTTGLAIGALTADLLTIVTEHEPRIPAPWQPLPRADPRLLALTGPWYWGVAPVVVRLLPADGLELTPLGGNGRASRFRAEPDGTWTGLEGYYAGETLRAVYRPDGTVSHLDLGTFVFTRQPYDPQAPVPGGTDPKGWLTASS